MLSELDSDHLSFEVEENSQYCYEEPAISNIEMQGSGALTVDKRFVQVLFVSYVSPCFNHLVQNQKCLRLK